MGGVGASAPWGGAGEELLPHGSLGGIDGGGASHGSFILGARPAAPNAGSGTEEAEDAWCPPVARSNSVSPLAF